MAAESGRGLWGKKYPDRRVLRSCDLGGTSMLWTIVVILFVLWLLGFFVFPIGGGLIHILLVIAVIVIIYNLITGRRGL
jgi:Family of unknown function (DUF5670)